MVLEAPAGSKRYESFLSLDMLDQMRFISKARPQGALAGILVPIDARTKNCETRPNQLKISQLIPFSVCSFFFK